MLRIYLFNEIDWSTLLLNRGSILRNLDKKDQITGVRAEGGHKIFNSQVILPHFTFFFKTSFYRKQFIQNRLLIV